MFILPIAFYLSLLTAPAHAALDSTALSNERRAVFAGISFYCPQGRIPILNSADTWSISPSETCSFSGPLDTRIDRRKLEPPVLNPLLDLTRLKTVLTSLRISTENERVDSFDFRLASGARFTAVTADAKSLDDTLLQLKANPATWGPRFVSVHSTQAGITELIRLARDTELFWQNPHFAEEQTVAPHLSGPRPYLPLPLLSKCGDGHEWREFTGARALLLIGDMHNAAETLFFEHVVATKSLSWVALETTRDRDGALARFLAAQNSVDEEPYLEALVDRKSRDNIASFKSLLRTLKRRKIPIVLTDYEEAYFNFPYTNTSFHGQVVAARNLMWVERLPHEWQGVGALLGGVDHFTATPHADFQDFARAMDPTIEMALVNPLEKCR